MAAITNREAKRIAIRNIVTVISADIANREDYWQTHPETNGALTASDLALVEREALAVMAVLERRADRLRSVRSGVSGA